MTDEYKILKQVNLQQQFLAYQKMTPINRNCPCWGKICMQCKFLAEVRFRPMDETYKDCEIYKDV